MGSRDRVHLREGMRVGRYLSRPAAKGYLVPWRFLTKCGFYALDFEGESGVTGNFRPRKAKEQVD